MPYKKATHTFNRLSAPGRLAFPTLFAPERIKIQGQPTGDPRYSARLVIHKDNTAVLQEIEAALEKIAAEAWADIPRPVNFHWPLKNAAVAYPNDGNLTDCFVINTKARQESPPSVMRWGPNGELLTIRAGSSDMAMVFSGCEAYVSCAFYSYQTTSQNGGIGAGLNAVLVTGRDVGRFDARITGAAAFGDLAMPADMASGAPAPAEEEANPWM